MRDAYLLNRLIEETRGLPGWQVLIPVTEVAGAVVLGEHKVFPIDAPFEKLHELLNGKPFLSDPLHDGCNHPLGLMHKVSLVDHGELNDIVQGRLADTAGNRKRSRAQPGAIERSQAGSVHSAPEQQERTMADTRQAAADIFFASPDFLGTLSEEDKRWLERIKSASQDEIENSLVKAGVYTPDGRLTKKYGGNA